MSNTFIGSAFIALLCIMPKPTLSMCNRDSDVYSDSQQPHAVRVARTVNYPGYFQGTHFAMKFIEPIESLQHSIVKRDVKHQPNQTSLVFVFDTTASMAANLAQLRQSAELIYNKLSVQEDSPIYNYIFVPFKELWGEMVTGPALVTTDKQDLLNTLDKVKIEGGGDCPENMISGVHLAMQKALPESFLYTFSDATAKDYNLERNVTELIQRKQTTLSFLLTGYCNDRISQKYTVIERLARISNGQVHHLNTEDIAHILKDVGEKLHANNVLLNFFYFPKGRTYPKEFLVDKTVRKFNIMVSGQNVKVKIIDPNNNILDKPMTTVNLKNVTAIQIDSPVVGQWKLEVASEDACSVRITGTSNVLFTHGFSVQSPESMKDTTFNPLIGAPNILSIISSHKFNLTEVHFDVYPTYDESNFEESDPIILALNMKNSPIEGEYIYETVAFDPPEEPMKILVCGFDEENNPLKRLISTSVQMLDFAPPIVLVKYNSLKVIEGDPLFIECEVITSYPFKLLLKREEDELKRWQSEESMHAKYEINSTKLSDSGLYLCSASNEYGSINRKIQVKVIHFPKSITIPKSEYVLEEKQSNATIPCILSPEPKYDFNVSWFFNGNLIDINDVAFKTDGTELIIQHLSHEHSGNYTCLVSVNEESKSATTQLTILFAPKLQQVENETMFIPYGESVDVNCTGVASPLAQVKWKFPMDTEFNIFETPLQIQSFKFSDEGLYECELSNGVEPAALRRVTLRGEAKNAPNISKPGIKYLNITEGDNLNLMCHCEMCEPLQDFMWLHEYSDGKNETNLSMSDYNSDKFSNRIDYSLKIESVSVEDSGKYTCYLKNAFGSDTYSIELNVKIPPKIDKIEDKDMYHKCSVNQQANLVLFDAKDSTRTVPSHVYDCSGTDAHVADTNIVLLEANPNEKIQSIAIHSNESSIVTNCTLSDLRSPDLTQIISDKRSEVIGSHFETSSDVFECVQPSNESSTFFTKPPLVVFVAPSTLSKDDAKLIQVKSNSQTLLKCAAQSLQAKPPYACESFNNFASGKDSFYFLVEDPPKIQPNFNESITLKRGESISVACFAVGSPNLQVFWTEDESVIAINELRIESANEEFKEKNFTCVAENRFGIDYRSVLIKILDKPELTLSADENSAKNYIHLGSDFELSCPFKDFNSFNWIKNGKPFNNESTDIVFKDISRSDAGNFTCHVNNEVGESEYTYEIIVQYPPIFENFTSNGTTIDVSLSTNFSMECQVDGFPVPEIEWINNGKIISKNKTLFIENVDASMRGDYICIASNEHGATKFAFTLNPLFPPEAMVAAEQTVNVVQNNSILMNCSMKANPEPTFEWFKDDIIIPGATKHVFEIQGKSFSDGGIYKCVATNAVSNNSIRFNVNIFAGAFIRFISKNSTSSTKDAIVLTCDAYANPRPIVSWIHDNRVLITSSKSIHMNESLPTETFESDANTDSIEERLIQNGININGAIGHKQNHTVALELRLNEWPMGMHRFDCIASNVHGEDESSTFVERFMEPTILHQNNTIIEVLEGTPITLNCNVEGYPMPEIIWQKGDIDIDFTSTDSEKYSRENDNKNLRISYVSGNDDASYTCVAKNSIGVDTIDFILNILMPPKLRVPFKNTTNNGSNELETQLTIRYNEPLSIECPVIGNPQPEIVWVELNENEGNKTPENVRKSNGNLTLEIEHVTKSTAFVCYANNSVGNFSYSFKILVERPPEFRVLNGKENRYRIGDSFSLNCAVEGQPKPNISWYKSGELLDRKNSTPHDLHNNIKVASRTFISADNMFLRITNATNENFGEYMCVVENGLSTINRIFDIFFNPYWDKWSSWSECSKTCGKGFQKRHRVCHRMPSHSHQKNCSGKNEEVRQCTRGPCRLDWSQCSKTCGYGQTYRVVGNKVEIASCFRTACPGSNFNIHKYTPAVTWESLGKPFKASATSSEFD